MCIRDRQYADKRCDDARTAGAQRVSQRYCTTIHIHMFRIPVSYTHLRAHETVLDLVCRLLLEKKQH